MSDDAPINLRTVADYFGLPGTAPVEKDLHVIRAIRAVTSIDASPVTLVFGGSTALTRAHKIVRRMSEDVDFKIVRRPATSISRNGLRRALWQAWRSGHAIAARRRLPIRSERRRLQAFAG